MLELGCGAGVPDTQRLAARFRVTGVDISAEQVRRARVVVSEAEFIRADFTALELEPESFDAVVSFYAFNQMYRVSCSRQRSRGSTVGSDRPV